MKSVSKKRIILGMVAIIMGASIVTSCSQKTVSEEEISLMQAQLDSITAQYEKMKTANVEFDDRMSAKDQEIEAKTAEINDLIEQLRQANEATNNAELRARKTVNVGGDVESSCAEKKKLEKQVKSLESQIAKLEKKLNAQVEYTGDNSAELEAVNNKLKAKEGELKSMSEELTAKQKELRTKSEELTLKNAELQKQASKLKNLEAELAATVAATAKEKVEEVVDNSEVIRLKEKIASQESQINGLNSEIKRLTSDMESLNKQLAANDATVAQVENSVKAEANSFVEDLERQLADLRAQLSQKESELAEKQVAINEALQKASDAEAAAAKSEKALAEAKNATTTPKASPRTVNKKLAELQDLCESYATEIEALRLENEKLKVENEELHDQMCSLRKDSEQALEDNMKLVQKVALASVLVTNNMEATPGKSIVSGTVVKPSKKASTTNVVRLSFDILDNNVVDPGTIELYARIATASNRVVCNGNPSDYTFDMNGVNMNYTMKQDIEFSGKSRKIVMMWKRAEQVEMAPGLYWVTVYANGYEIGKTSFVVK